MFGSEVVNQILYERLTALPGIDPAFTGHIVGAMVAPQVVGLPAVLYYPEMSAYSGPMSSRQPAGMINYESLRYIVRAVCAGGSTDPIRAVAEAQVRDLDGLVLDYEYDGTWYQATFSAQGEVIPTTLIDGPDIYRQLGTVYAIELIRG